MLSYKFFVIQWKVKKGEKKEFQDDKECTEKHTILLLKFPLFTYEDKQSIITLWKMMGKHTTSARFLKKKKKNQHLYLLHQLSIICSSTMYQVVLLKISFPVHFPRLLKPWKKYVIYYLYIHIYVYIRITYMYHVYIRDLRITKIRSLNENCMNCITKRSFTIKYIVKKINSVAYIKDTGCNKVF